MLPVALLLAAVSAFSFAPTSVEPRDTLVISAGPETFEAPFLVRIQGVTCPLSQPGTASSITCLLPMLANGSYAVSVHSGSFTYVAPMRLTVGSAAPFLGAGRGWSAVLHRSGRLYAWGTGSYGELLSGSTTPIGDQLSSIPIPFLDIPLIGAVSLADFGYEHACFTDTGAPTQLRCWGRNQNSQLGVDAASVPALGDDPSETPSNITFPNVIVQIALGEAHTCANTYVGLYCLGSNAAKIINSASLFFQTPTLAFSTNPTFGTIQKLVSGANHICVVHYRTTPVLASDLRCWGDNSHGQLGQGSTTPWSGDPSFLPPIAQGFDISVLTAGDNHNCILDTSGQLYCWGSGAYGQLGTGSPSDQTSSFAMSPVDLFTTIIDVVAGARSTCALDYRGVVMCFGANDFGQLGIDAGTPVSSAPTYAIGDAPSEIPPSPVYFTANNPILLISPGDKHWCAFQTSGAVTCFGDASHGEMGTGLTLSWAAARSSAVFVSTPTPPLVRPSSGAPGASIAMESTSIFLNMSATPFQVRLHGVVCETSVSNDLQSKFFVPEILPGTYTAQLQAGTQLSSFTFTVLSSETRLPQLVQGHGMDVMILGVSGTDLIYGWNSNSAGQLGLGSIDSPNFASRSPQNAERIVAFPPAAIASPGLVKAVIGGESVCALRGDGQLYCWGRGIVDGATVIGDDFGEMPPLSINSNLTQTTVSDFCFGSGFICALNPSQMVACVGDNTYGQRGVPESSAEGVPVPLGVPVSAITCGADHACALASGDIYCWGRNQYGQLGVGDTTDRGLDSTPLTPSAISSIDVTAIVSQSESSFSCVLKGTEVYCFGENSLGQLGTKNTDNIGANNASVYVAVDLGGPAVAVSLCGNQSACAILSDGSVKCWGSGLFGQRGDGTFLSRGSAAGDFPLPAVNLPFGAWAFGANSVLLVTGDIYSWGNGVATPELVAAPPLLLDAFAYPSIIGAPSGSGQVQPEFFGGPGDDLEIHGYGFGTNITAIHVFVAGVACAVSSVTSLRIVCTIPEVTPGTRWVHVVRDGHAKSNALSFKIIFSGIRGSAFDVVILPPQSLADLTVVAFPTAGQTLAAGADQLAQSQGAWPELNATFSRGFIQPFISMAIGPRHSCYVASTNQKLFCFGHNNAGQLGLEMTSEYIFEPVPALLSLSPTLSLGVAVGGDHTCVFDLSWVRCFGSNVFGQLGRGVTTSPYDMIGDEVGEMANITAIDYGTNVTAVVCGTAFTCILTNFSVYCFGANAEGQLGLAPSTFESTPPTEPVRLGGLVLALAAGEATVCAIMVGNLQLRCFGRNFGFAPNWDAVVSGSVSGPIPVVPIAVVQIDSVVLGADFLCVLMATSSVKCIGTNAVGQLATGSVTAVHAALPDFPPADSQLVEAGEGIVSISAGYAHLCALTATGILRCAGANNFGQLGSTSPNPVGDQPQDLPPLESSVPPVLTSLIDPHGDVFDETNRLTLSLEVVPLILYGAGFGTDASDLAVTLGGFPGTITSATPTKIEFELPVSIFMLSNIYAVRLSRGGRLSPSEIRIRVRMLEVTAGGYGVALTPVSGPTSDATLVFAPIGSGDLYVAGDNSFGQLGLGSANSIVSGDPASSSAAWASLSPKEIAAGASHVCAISASNLVYCLGGNAFGQTGQPAGFNSGSQPGDVPLPVNFTQSALDFTSICAGESHTCVTHSAGFSCFGSDEYGQLGNGLFRADVDGSAPLPVFSHSFGASARVTCGRHHSCLWNSTTATCFGRNYEGQLGAGITGNVGDLSTVVLLGQNYAIAKLASGGNHNCALFRFPMNFIRCWGSNSYGQLGNGGSTIVGFTPWEMPPLPLLLSESPIDIVLLSDSTCVHLSSGTIKCTGRNSAGQLGVGDTTDRNILSSSSPNVVLPAEALVSRIAGGANHFCVTSLLGNQLCFGDNSHGQLWITPIGESSQIGDSPPDFPVTETIFPPWIQSVFEFGGDDLTARIVALIGTGFVGSSNLVSMSLNVNSAPAAGLQLGQLFFVGYSVFLGGSAPPGLFSGSVSLNQSDAVVRTGRLSFSLMFPFLKDVSSSAAAPGSELTVLLSRYEVHSGNTWMTPGQIFFVPSNTSICCQNTTYSNITGTTDLGTGWVRLSFAVPELPPSSEFLLIYQTIESPISRSLFSSTAQFQTCTIGCAQCTAPGLSTAACQVCDETAGFYLNFAGSFCIDDSTGCPPGTIATTRGNQTVKHCGCDHTLGLVLNVTGTECISATACPLGSYPNVTVPDHRCLACHPSCVGCLSGFSDGCTSCSPGVQFSVNQGGASQSCSGTCNDCLYTLQRDPDTDECACPPGTFYFDQDGTCTTCIGDTYEPSYRIPDLDARECTSCPNFMGLPPTSNHSSLSECECKANLQPFPDISFGCGCPSGSFYSVTLKVCVLCPLNTFQPSFGINGSCIPCAEIGPHRVSGSASINPTDCVCDTANGFELDPVSQQCLCRPGYFLVGAACQKCLTSFYSETYNENLSCSPCATANDPYRITEADSPQNSSASCVCPFTMIPHPETGVCTCPPGTFLEYATTTCRLCGADTFYDSFNLTRTCTSCESAVGPLRITHGALGSNSSDACRCPFTLVTDLQGNCACPAGTYFVPSEKGCRTCIADTFRAGFGNSSDVSCIECRLVGDSRTTNGRVGSVSAADCVCKEGFYPSRDGRTCLDCRQLGATANCGGALSSSFSSANRTTLELAGIVVQAGYWLTTNSFYLPDGVGIDQTSSKAVAAWFGIFKCPLEAACLGGSVEENCADGYTGPVCGLCDEGFGRLGKECAKCPSPAASSFLTFFIILLVVVGCMAVVHFAHPDRVSNDSKSVALKISIMHMQIIGFTGNFASQWPQTLAKVFAIPSSAATVSSASDNIALDCALSPSLYSRASLIFLLPLILVAAVSLFYSARAAVRGRFRETVGEIEQGSLVLLYVAHPGIVQGVLKLMVCVSVGEKKFAMSDMSVDCNSSSYIALQAFAAIYFVLYGVGGLLLVFLLMRRKPENWAFLSTGYRKEFYYWDIVVTLRQIVFVVVALFASPPLQLFFGTWILLISWISENFVHPYVERLHQRFVFASIAVLLITVSVGNLFFNGVLSSDQSDGVVVSVLLILLNFGAIVGILGLSTTEKLFFSKKAKETELAPL